MLKINNIQMPEPKLEGVTVSEEKVWSSNTQRSSSTTMVGTILGIKKTVSIQWPDGLPYYSKTDGEWNDCVKKVLEQISDKDKPFIRLYYSNGDATIVDTDVYFGTPTYKLYSAHTGIRFCKDFSVDAIER